MRALLWLSTGLFLTVLTVGSYRYGRVREQAEQALPPVTVEDAHFVKNHQPFWIHGVNYYPQRTPWSLFWPQYDPEVIAQDLQKISGLGFNTVRIFLPHAYFRGPFDQPDSQRYLKQLKHFLATAEAQGLYCVLTLFDFYQDYQNPEGARQDLERLVPALRSSSAILAWDVKNELDRDVANVPVAPEVLQQWLDQVIPTLQRLDPDHLVTLGWSRPEAMLRWRTTVDYDTFHDYERPEVLGPRLDFVSSQRRLRGIRRPWVMGELGYHTWPEAQPDPHFVEHQFNYLNAVLATRLVKDLDGQMVWNLYDYHPSLREPWVLQGASVQYYMGLLTVEGQAKSGLQALQSAVFVRDALTRGEPTLESRQLEAVFWAANTGEALLKSETGQLLHQWPVQKGLNQLRWEVTPAEIQALIYLKTRYLLRLPEVWNLAHDRVPAQDHALTLRLR